MNAQIIETFGHSANELSKHLDLLGLKSFTIMLKHYNLQLTIRLIIPIGVKMWLKENNILTTET